MADSRLHERDQQKSGDETAAVDHDDHVTQIQDPEISNLSKTKISESSTPTESSDDDDNTAFPVPESFISESSRPRERRPPSHRPLPPPAPPPAMDSPSYSVYRQEPTDTIKATVRNIIIVTSDSLQSINMIKDGEEIFPEEEAVCKSCFGKFEIQNMFMTKCNCPKALLIHQECIIKSARNGNNKCNVCEQEVTSFAVKWRRESIKSDNETSTRQKGKRNTPWKRFVGGDSRL